MTSDFAIRICNYFQAHGELPDVKEAAQIHVPSRDEIFAMDFVKTFPGYKEYPADFRTRGPNETMAQHYGALFAGSAQVAAQAMGSATKTARAPGAASNDSPDIIRREQDALREFGKKNGWTVEAIQQYECRRQAMRKDPGLSESEQLPGLDLTNYRELLADLV